MKDENKKAGAFVNIETEQQGPDDLTIAQFKKLPDAERAAYLKEALQPVLDALLNSDLQELLQDSEARANLLTPYIEAVLQNPKYNGITAEQVLDNMTLLGKAAEPDDITAEILKRAQKKQRAAEAREKQKSSLMLSGAENAPRVKYNQYDTFIFLKDNFTNTAFSLMPDIRMEAGKPTLYVIFRNKDKKKIEVKLKAVFTFDKEYLHAFNITDVSIDPGYDRAVCMACDNLFFNGNSKVTLAKILKELGIPYSQKEADKLLNTLRKLKSINMIINNKAVLELYGIGEKYREIDGAFLPIRIVDDKLLINGNIAETSIIILDYSPFWLVADPINQKTEYDKQLFMLYSGRRTSKYWRVLISLMKEISYLRSGNRSSKFLLSSIYEDVGDSDAHQRASTKKIVYELLEQVFKPLDYICDYTTGEDKEFFIASYHKDRHPVARLKEPKKRKN